MEIKNKKEITLYNIFLRYLVSFCVLTVLLLFLAIAIFGVGISTGILFPANYAQNKVEELKKELIEDDNFDKSKIEHPYTYGLYNNNLDLVSSDFNEKQLHEALKYLAGSDFDTKYIYTKVELKDGVCVISYDIKAHFSSKFLNNIFPYPEVMMIILFFILFIVVSVLLVRNFGKRLKKELKPLKQSTELIMKQNLDFKTVPTNIKEFNEVLTSIENMKAALKESLEIQWKSEQRKKEQIAALAHDIKTPLTIIKGNAELLSESEFVNEDKEYIDFIIRNSDKIEKYISLLIEISKAESNIDYTMETIDFNDFLQELICEIKMMCTTKNIISDINVSDPPKAFEGNRGLLMRAFTNIIINSMDYSNEGDKIEVSVNGDNGKLKFTVKDSGRGFTKEGLKNATNQFYMEESERRPGKHYGIGLYTAQAIAKKHGGEVVLKNREDRQGAEVSLIIFQGMEDIDE